MRLRLFVCCFSFLFIAAAARAAEPFEIKDGDRVLFLGDTLLEREGTYGSLETRMHEQFPDRRFTVRNLSWSGETPRGWSRASFDNPDKGTERLKEDIAKVRPTVVFLGFGMAASLQEMTDRSGDITLNPDPKRYGEEPMSAARFKRELGELMDAISGRVGVPPAGSGVSPERTSRNAQTPPQVREGGTPSPAGGTPTLPETAAVRFVLLSPIRHEDLRAVKPGLPDPAAHNALLEQYSQAIEEKAKGEGRRAKGEESTTYVAGGTFATDNGIHLTEAGYAAWAASVAQALGWNRGGGSSLSPFGLRPSPSLRAAVISKNELFFHQFRPANSTYLFGFRKHEQGQNAKEMPMFDPLIAAAEAEIDRLKASEASPVTPPHASSTKEASPTTKEASPVTKETASLTKEMISGVKKSPSGVSSPAPAAAKNEVVPPPLPDFTVEDGYQIELWAQNPLLEKPTQMNWDAQGRLWVCSSSLYPQIEPGQAANDKILVLSDTDGDGKADKSEVFADGLLIPTGVVPDIYTAEAQRRGGTEEKAVVDPSSSASPRLRASAVQSGCFVGQSTELLHLRDTDGDGRADQKRVVFSGFGTEDTHHIVHTLRWGPDGRLFFHQSVYIHSHLETPWGMVRLNSGGVFAYDPRTERVEVFAKGLWNTWGHAWDDWGQSFLTDGAGSNGISWAFPGATFAPFEGSRRQMPSVSPGAYPKFAGLEIVKSPHFPAEWQGNLITCDFRAHRIVRFAITDLSLTAEAQRRGGEGEKAAPSTSPSASSASPHLSASAVKSGYVTTEQPDLVRTTDLSFRPIDVRLGPDGALYVADWSNPVINHGEVDFRDPRRDKHMGRIWRITKKGAPALKWADLTKIPARDLTLKISSDSQWERQQATGVLSARLNQEMDSGDRGPAYAALEVISDELSKLPEDRRMQGVITVERLPPGSHDWPDGIDTDRFVRTAMARLIGEWWNAPRIGDESFRSRLAEFSADANPRVRLEAMRALARIPTAQSAGLVLDAALKTPADDPHYDFAAWQSINDLAKPWTDAIASGAWKTEGKEAQLAYGLKSIDPALAGATLSRLFAAGKVPVDGSGPWIELIGDAGGPAELQRLLDGLLAGYVGDCCATDETRAIDTRLALTGPAADRAAAALLTAARVRAARPAAHSELVSALFQTRGEIGLTAIRLAGLWKTPDAVAKITELLDSLETKPPLRRASVDGLRAAGGPAALALLDRLTRPEETTDTRAAALVAMVQVKLGDGVNKAAAILPTLPEAALLGTWRGLLGVKGAPDAFAVKFGKQDAAKAMPAPVIAAAVRAAREVGRPGAKLLAALAPVAGAAATAPSTDYLGLAAQTKQNGDPAKGELIYRRATLACVTCHAIGGAGGHVGPDMTSIGASAPLDYLIESILNPNAKVKEGYNAVSLTLADGTTATGTQARETASEIILRDAIGKETGVPKAAIKGKTDIGSMMPAGLTAPLQPREALDLYAFLSQLGKPGPYDASKGKVARVWRLYPGTAAGEVVSASYDPAKNPGFPGYTLVDGRFVKDLLAEATMIAASGAETVLLATQFQASGKTRLKLTGAAAAWLDGQPLTLGSEIAPDLANGTHTLVVKLGVKELPAVLRAASEDARFLGN